MIISLQSKMSANLFGLTNSASNCYLNSVLQCILRIGRVAKMIGNLSPREGTASSYLQKLFQNKNEVFDSQPLVLFFCKRSGMSYGDQQDAYETLNAILKYLYDLTRQESPTEMLKIADRLKAEAKEEQAGRILCIANNFSRDYSPLLNTFISVMDHVISCKSCEHESTIYEPFQVLSVPVEDTIESSIMSMFKESEMESAKCEHCAAKNMVSRYYIGIFTEILIIHLKRFNNDRNKNSAAVRFDRQINLRKVAVKSKKDIIYDIFGIVCHWGRGIQGGHYTTTIVTKESLLYVDDANISKHSTNDLEPLFEVAYMIFARLRH